MGSVLEIRDLGGFFLIVYFYTFIENILLRENILKFLEEWHALFMEQVNLFKNMVEICEGNLESDTVVLTEIIFFALC